ncbi:unnamed protein product [Adineta steineri]|uniref:G-protein coupled receptors family 1 profile domain-containing protein n=1 Tax=Adineta steineri TaxID=433720 RepID=A0A818X7B5_9BILA|nr:unnamed protein product [Adineta steineri]CAF3735025.1 unnamed protein product [Adineta steineri]
MSSSAIIFYAQRNAFRFGGPLLITIGSIGCILNLMVFTNDTLRKNPCTICFRAVNIVDFIYFYLGLLLTTLAVGYDIDPSATNIVFCRFRYYIALVLACWEASYIILAAIDRTLVTSRKTGTRKLSTRRLIRISVISITIFWLLFHIHALIFTQILQYGPNFFACYYQPGTYTKFMTFSSLLLNGTLPPLFMGIFGLWTVRNIRKVNRGIRPASLTNTGNMTIGRPRILRSKDQQLIRMLFMNIISYIIFKCPVTIFLIYIQITQNNGKSAEQNIIEQSVIQLTYFWYFIDNSISCYTNLIVSKTFRTELKRILLNICSL